MIKASSLLLFPFYLFVYIFIYLLGRNSKLNSLDLSHYGIVADMSRETRLLILAVVSSTIQNQVISCFVHNDSTNGIPITDDAKVAADWH